MFGWLGSTFKAFISVKIVFKAAYDRSYLSIFTAHYFPETLSMASFVLEKDPVPKVSMIQY